MGSVGTGIPVFGRWQRIAYQVDIRIHNRLLLNILQIISQKYGRYL